MPDMAGSSRSFLGRRVWKMLERKNGAKAVCSSVCLEIRRVCEAGELCITRSPLPLPV